MDKRLVAEVTAGDQFIVIAAVLQLIRKILPQRCSLIPVKIIFVILKAIRAQNENSNLLFAVLFLRHLEVVKDLAGKYSRICNLSDDDIFSGTELLQLVVSVTGGNLLHTVKI